MVQMATEEKPADKGEPSKHLSDLTNAHTTHAFQGRLIENLELSCLQHPALPFLLCGRYQARGPHWAVTATLGAGAGIPRGAGSWGAAFWLLSADRRSRRSA